MRARLYDELLASTRAAYDIVVAPSLLASLREITHGGTLGLESHRALARSVLAGESVSSEHPYRRLYFQRVRVEKPSLSWKAVWQNKSAHIRDIAQNGVKEPVDLFCANQGVSYYHGYHRLAAALESGQQTIPVRAHLLDAELAELADRVFGIYSDEFRMTLYQPIDHPFFRLFPVQLANGPWDEKVAAVVEVAKGWPGPVVEVGAHFGMLTRALRRAGVDARATDISGFYLELQPLFEAVGLGAVPYERRAIRDLTAEEGPVRLVMMGLMHHLMGKPDLWAMMTEHVLPWMQRAVPEIIVEMSLLNTYLGRDAAKAAVSDDEVKAFWAAWGYTATRLAEGAMGRVTYHGRRARDGG